MFVEAKTGQEEEDSFYIRRAKLYRFTDGEWKERGLGNVKILRHLVTKTRTYATRSSVKNMPQSCSE
uniref:RanBD1 domain-containing protein n=1 Tax=Glossina palpalis gambiensis TaxID=67801 RepID=A0A1B0C323_9MUSC